MEPGYIVISTPHITVGDGNQGASRALSHALCDQLVDWSRGVTAMERWTPCGSTLRGHIAIKISSAQGAIIIVHKFVEGFDHATKGHDAGLSDDREYTGNRILLNRGGTHRLHLEQSIANCACGRAPRPEHTTDIVFAPTWCTPE